MISFTGKRKRNVENKANLDKTLTKLDLFPREVRLTFRGKDKNKTVIGAGVSIICGLFVLAYGGFRALPLTNEDNTTATKNTLLVSSDSKFFANFKPDWSKGLTIKPDVMFALGMGPTLLTPEYGHFEVR